MLILLALPIFFIFAPVLIGGNIFAEQPFWESMPLYSFYQRAIQSGESFLWNPLNFSGFPSFVGTVGFFSPVHYLAFKFFPVVDAFHWLVFFDFLLAAFFTALLLRDFGVSFLGAYLGGLAYLLSQIVYTANLTMANTVLFLPLLFWVLARLGRPRPFGYVGLGILIVAWGWAAGVTQYVLYAFLTGAAFIVFLGWRERQVFFTGVTVLILGTALGMVQLFPTVLLAEFSTRIGGLSYAEASIDPLLPTDFIRFLLPFFEPPLGVPFGSRGAEAFLYFGVIPLFFFLSAFSVRGSVVYFFKWLFGGTVAIAIVYSPFYWLLSKLPFLSYFRGQSRWMTVGLFAASILAGFGFNAFLKSHEERGGGFLMRLFIIAAAFVMLAVGAATISFGFFGAELSTFGGTIIERLIAPAPDVQPFYARIMRLYLQDLERMTSLTEPKVFIPILFLLIGVASLWLSSRPKPRRWIVPWLTVFTALNFVAIAPLTFSLAPRSVATDPAVTVRFLQEHEGRVFSFLADAYVDEALEKYYPDPGAADEAALQAATLFPNTNLFFGVEHAGYFDQIRSRSMARLLNLLGDPYTGVSDLRALGSREEQIRLFESRKPLLDFLGIRYIVSGYALDPGRFGKAFEGEINAGAPRLTIYENREARPLVSFADRVTFVRASEEEIFRRYREQNFSGLFADCASPCEPQVRSFGPGSAEITERKNAKVTVRTATQGPTFLIFSQNHLPGWAATVDGREVQIQTVNTVYIGIEVPPGEHQVEFAYSYPCPPREFLDCLSAAF